MSKTDDSEIKNGEYSKFNFRLYNFITITTRHLCTFGNVQADIFLF